MRQFLRDFIPQTRYRGRWGTSVPRSPTFDPQKKTVIKSSTEVRSPISVQRRNNIANSINSIAKKPPLQQQYSAAGGAARGKGGSFLPMGERLKIMIYVCAFIVMELLRITRQIHCTAVEQRATLINGQYNRDWGTSYSRPPIDPYLTSPCYKILAAPLATRAQHIHFASSSMQYNSVHGNVEGTKVCPYNWHSAGTVGWPC